MAGADVQPRSQQPRRRLGFWMCLALVVGNMVGSGVFLLPAALAPFGWNAVFGWTLTVGGSLCLAFVFASLARAFPREGGPYAYSRIAFGEGAAFAISWSYWISIWVANAAIAVAAVSYLSIFAPGLAQVTGLPAALALALLWTLTILNCLSIRAAGGFQLVTTLLKLLPLVAAIGIGLAVVAGDGGATLRPFSWGEINGAAITATGALTLWAMMGFESATVPAGNVRDPERNIPRATMVGTLIAGIVYILACSAVALLLPAEQAAASNAPFADFVGMYLGRGAALTLALFAAISCIGALNGWVLLQGQMPLAMARGGSFPRWFAATSPAGTPVRAQLVSSVLVTILVISNYSRAMNELFVFMALLATVAALIMYFACSLAVFRLAATGELKRSPVLLATAAVGTVYALWTLYGAGPEPTAWGAVLLASGIPVYFLMRAGRSSRAAEAYPAAPQGSAAGAYRQSS